MSGINYYPPVRVPSADGADLGFVVDSAMQIGDTIYVHRVTTLTEPTEVALAEIHEDAKHAFANKVAELCKDD